MPVKKNCPLIALVFLLMGTTSCQHSLPHYLATQGFQQGGIYLKAKPIHEWIQSYSASVNEKAYLTLSLEVLDFARNRLKMKTGKSYQKYARLNGKAVTWVVIAAEKNILAPHLFHYPILGDLPYRGYFKESEANEFAKWLQTQNLDVIVRPVRAYSSTGWLADPVLSTMFSNEVEFIELLFHELLHLQFYWSGQADFNEAFATWFSEKATLLFLNEKADSLKSRHADAIASYENIVKQDKILLTTTQSALKFAHEKYKTSGTNIEETRKQVFDGVAELYRKAGFENLANAQWNNARLVSLSTYQSLIPDIEKHFNSSGMNFIEFTQKISASNPDDWLSFAK